MDTQVPVPIIYEGLELDSALRLDLLVSEMADRGTESIEIMHPVYEAQILSYLRLTGLRLGLRINFHIPLTKDVMKRIIL